MKAITDCLPEETNPDRFSHSKIELVHKEIQIIGFIPPPFQNITKLHLSHNKIVSLEGIQSLPQLKSLSVGFNRIPSLKEFLRIQNKSKLHRLRITFNPLCKNPNYRRQFLVAFPNLEQLDDLYTPRDLKSCHELIFLTTSKILIPFLLILNRDTQILDQAINRSRVTGALGLQSSPEALQRILRSLYNTKDELVSQPGLLVSEIMDRCYSALNFYQKRK